ncbi:MAG: aspartate aminotransferase family protein [Dehalococcoidia bacterium]|nr:aspartate aminotransferase family protein [Dehalococcoidia bacterium]
MRTFQEQRHYEAATPKSRALHQQADQYLAGGETRTSAFWSPYPVTIARGQGCHVWDVDGNDRIDFVNNFTTLVHGHNHPTVLKVIQEQLSQGTSFFGPSEPQLKLAKLLCERVPSVERIRFTSSGTEATMNCVRAARAFTGRTKIAKCEGGYHGTHEALAVSVQPSSLAVLGRAERPNQVPADVGLPQSVIENVVVLPYNNTEAARQLLTEHHKELAAVFLEPMLGSGGMIPADPEYLAMLRSVTSKYGILLVFDEVITFQVATGGAQEWYNIKPDMTAFGKIIGGGLAAGAFGGRKDVMAVYEHQQGPAPLNHAGTFNGHPLAMAAGIATFQMLTPAAHERLNALGDRLRQQVQQLCNELETPAQVTGLGPLFGIHFTRQPVRSYRDVLTVGTQFRHEVFLGLLNEGVFLYPTMLGSLSTAITEKEVDTLTAALRRVLVRLTR